MGIGDDWCGFVQASILLVAVCIFCPSSSDALFSDCKPLSPALLQRAERAARKFAPIVWLAPDEKFFPSSTLDFLEHTKPSQPFSAKGKLPVGSNSWHTYLKPREPIAVLLANTSSFLHGRSPEFQPVPAYAVASSCCNLRTSQAEDAPFEITYWLFFPFSQGKEICTISAGALGPVPFPWVRKACLGKVKTYGNHLGDWEHVTLSFPASGVRPLAMYVSTHEAGALYLAPLQPSINAVWDFKGYEVRKGIKIGTPRFPKNAFNLSTGRPVLFAAKGSHGLWTLPGKHKYISFPALVDETGFGTMWRTWQSLQVLAWPPRNEDPDWFKFEGHWGGEKQDCHPLSERVCSQTDGPRGIPTKTHSFRCLAQGITLKSF